MYQNESTTRLAENYSRMLVYALSMRNALRNELANDGLSKSARKRFEEALEKSNYQVKIGMEFRRLYREHLDSQTARQPEPKVEVPQYSALELVAVAD